MIVGRLLFRHRLPAEQHEKDAAGDRHGAEQQGEAIERQRTGESCRLGGFLGRSAARGRATGPRPPRGAPPGRRRPTGGGWCAMSRRGKARRRPRRGSPPATRYGKKLVKAETRWGFTLFTLSGVAAACWTLSLRAVAVEEGSARLPRRVGDARHYLNLRPHRVEKRFGEDSQRQAQDGDRQQRGQLATVEIGNGFVPLMVRFLDRAEEHADASWSACTRRPAARRPHPGWPAAVRALAVPSKSYMPASTSNSPRKPFSPGRPTLDKVMNTMKTPSRCSRAPMPP